MYWENMFGGKVTPDDDFKVGIFLTTNTVFKPNDVRYNRSKNRKKGKMSSMSLVFVKLYTGIYSRNIYL